MKNKKTGYERQMNRHDIHGIIGFRFSVRLGSRSNSLAREVKGGGWYEVFSSIHHNVISNKGFLFCMFLHTLSSGI